MRCNLLLIAISGLLACDPAVDVEGSTTDATTSGSSGGPLMTTAEPGTTSPQPGTSGPVSSSGPVSTGDSSGPMSTGDSSGPMSTGDSSGPMSTGDSSGFASTGDSSSSASTSTGVDSLCGDGEVNPGEQCDQEDVQGLDCETLGIGVGEVECTEMCLFDTSGCQPISPLCGDGNVQVGSEQCDGDNVQGFDCETIGQGIGQLGCTKTCAFDTSDCSDSVVCGNGDIEPGEQCEGNDLQGFDCASLGLGTGMLSCDPVNCFFDTSGCIF